MAPLRSRGNAIEFLKELKMNGIGLIHAKSKQDALTLGSEAWRLVSRRRDSWLRLVPVMLCLFAGAIAAQGQTVTSTVNAGELPYAVGVNPVTNKAYVVNNASGTVTVINKLTNSSTTVPVGPSPYAVAMNPVTNQIYVVNNGTGTGGNSVSVINGATDTVAQTITVGNGPDAVAVNPVTNTIYVANKISGTVTVIDGTGVNSPATVTVGTQPAALAINPVNGQVYVANYSAGTVTVITGTTPSSPITVGTGPTAIAVNAMTNEVYVANYSSGNVSVISGNSATTVAAGTNPNAIAVNEVTNKIYVANFGSSNITVIDGANGNAATTLPTASGTTNSAVAVNPVTNQVYVATQGTTPGTVTVINGAIGGVAATVSTTLTVGQNPRAVAVNPVSNTIYVANQGIATANSTVSVIDGSTNLTGTVGVGNFPYAVAVNPVTNKIYVANYSSNSVTVIDPTDLNAPTTVSAGSSPIALAVNPQTNLIYVANNVNSGTVSVINGTNNTVGSQPIAVGKYPDAIAVNPVTNKIYVANQVDGTATIIDGTGATQPVTLGLAPNPSAVAVNTLTNKAYFAVGGNPPSTGIVVVLDGANNPTVVPAGVDPIAVGVNQVTNKVYVANFNDGTVTMIDANNANATSTIGVGSAPVSIGVNPLTNEIYVANESGNSVSVINGAINTTASTLTLSVGKNPSELAVNPATNKVYVTNLGATAGVYSVSIIDGALEAVTGSVTTGSQPGPLAVNPVTNQVFIANQITNNVTVLSEQQVQTVPITTTVQPLTGDRTASLTPTFSLSTSNTLSTASVDNVFYQMDTWEAGWTTAADAGVNSFTAAIPTLQPGYHILYAYATDGEEGTSANTGLQNSPLIGNIAAYPFMVAAQGATLAPTSLSFGDQEATTEGTPQTATLTNNGATPLTFTISSTDATEYPEGNTDSCTVANGQLAVGTSCTISISFAPQSPTGLKSATLTVTDNSNGIPGSAQTISLSGTATGNVSPGLAWTAPTAINYGAALTATQLDATATAQGTFSYNPPIGTILGAGTRTLSVSFTPNDPSTYAPASLNVQIVVNQVTLTVAAVNASRPYGQSNPAFSATYTGFVNSDTISVLSGLPSLTTTATTNSPVGSNYVITAGAGNLSAANYTFSFVNGTLTINQATPTITWPTPAAITYGTALSSTQLNATSNAIGGGTFTYTPASGVLLQAGTQTLSVSFAPQDTTDYATPTPTTVQLVVHQAIPTITWAAPAAINYPVALSSTQLDAVASVQGTLTYTPPSGTVLKAGSQTLSVSLAPIDATDYTTATATVPLTVNQTTPTITWPTPAPITYGTALSSAQLDAVSSAPGTFTYTPSAGSVLGAGTKTINANFVPMDTIDYTTATASVQLVVNQAPPNSQATVTTTIPAGTGPKAVAVNPLTNTIYVANVGSGSVTVISGTTNSTTPVTVGAQPDAVAVNPLTNKIYVANYSDGTVSVIDGATNAVSTPIPVGSDPTVIAVNTALNQVYVVNQGSNSVTVLSGATGSTAATVIGTDTVGTNPYAVAVNPVTGLAYVTNQGSNSVSVIDGANPTTVSTTIPNVGANPYSIAVNPATNKVFVTDLNGTTVSVIDPTNSNAVTPVTVGTTGAEPWAIDVNPVTNEVYVADYGTGTVTVIAGSSPYATTSVTVGTNPDAVAVNTLTNQVYVANLGSANFTVIDGASNTPTNVGIGSSPVALAVNPVTGKVYLANNGGNTVSVVDGATNTTSTVSTGDYPSSVAVNPVTNTIYVANAGGTTVTAINGTTTTSIPAGTAPSAVAVNPLTNQIYVTNYNNVTVIDGSTNNPTTLTVGDDPDAVGVNPVTNTIYVANYVNSTVSVINGSTNAVSATTIPVGKYPTQIAINTAIDKVYVLNNGDKTVTVIDGSTNTVITTVTVGDSPSAIAVDPVTNKIYVANSNLDNYPIPGTATVIDGVTYSTTTVNCGVEPFAIAVNPLTNMIYVVNKDGNSVTVINGATYATTTLSVGSAPFAVAVNPVSNKIYVPDAEAVSGSFYISVIDGATNFITTLSAGSQPAAVAVNPMTNQVYIANQESNNVTALTEQQVQTVPIVTTIQPLTGNQTTSLVPTFSFTAANTLTAATPDNLLYQVDTWQGPWTAATNQGSGSFSAKLAALQPGYHILYAYSTDGEEGTSTITGSQNSPLIGNITGYGFTVVAQLSGSGASLSPSSMTFQAQGKNTTSPAQTATLVNASNSVLTFAISFSGNTTDFAEATNSDTCSTLSGQLAANASCTIAVTFTPTATGSRSATLTVTDNSNGVAGSTQTVTLSGTGTGSENPGLAWSAPASISYGNALSSTQLNATANVAGTFVYTPAAGTVLTTGPQTLSVTFTPQDTNDYAAATTTVQITITPATLTVTSANATRQYGQANPGFTANYSGFVNGDGASVLSGSPAFSTTATTASNVGSYPITVSQGTLAAANYSFNFVSTGSLSVTAATTTINWGPLAPIVVGTALTSTQLSATATIAGGASVTGSFVYNPTLGTVLSAGAQTLSVSFTPTGQNASNYTVAAGTVSLQVNQATAVFSISDTSTQGNWQGVYGGDGYSMAPAYQSLPNYATFQLQGDTPYTWTSSTTDPRALELPGVGTGRIAATWYGATTYTMAVNLTDGRSHQVALYAIDWDAAGRAEKIQIVDAVTQSVLDSETISNFQNGVYLVWTVSGNVTINVIPIAGNGVISGVFFGGSNATESVSVTPMLVSLAAGQTQQFAATVKNGTGQPTWTISAVSPAGAGQGTLSSAGLYTAASSVTTTTMVTVKATSADLTASGTATLLVRPPSTNYVTSASLGTLRNNYSGWVGIGFKVGSSPVTVTGLGRIFAPGNTGSHTVEIVTASNGQGVSGGSVSISMAGGTAGSFVYANLPSTVTLNANTSYYILTQETAGGDQWYDDNTTLTTTSVASETGAVWSPDGVTLNPIGSAGESYGPVDFLYTITVTQPGITTQPQSQTVSAGATATFSVTATGGGLSYQWESEAPGGSSFTNITGATSSSYTTPATTLAQSGTQYMCVVTNSVGSTPSNAATLTVTNAPPTANYVTATSLGSLRNNFSGWVGMRFTVGSSPVTVSGLGRMFAPGDTGSHTVKIVTASNSQNLSGGSVTISMAGGTPGSFVYASLPSTVTLNANTAYYILSQETASGDQWYDMNTTITTTTVASETGSVYSGDGATYSPNGSAGQAYVPVDFVYTTTTTLSQPAFTKQPQSQTVSAGATATFSVTATGGGLTYQWQSEAPGGSSFTNITGATSSSYTTPATTLTQSGTQYMCVVTNTVGSTPSNAATLTVTTAPTGTNYVTSASLGGLRNDFSGWVGMSFTVGSSPVTVSGLGRMFAPGDTGSHAVKIVTASSSQDLTGGSVTISMAGGTAGSFVYANLPSTVTLSANTAYYILSQEAAAGDQWYDINTTITTTAVASETSAVWSQNGATYTPIGTAGQAYVPVDFVYTTTTTLSQPAFTKQPQSQTVSAGATATFSVTATGGGLSYQWQSEAPGGSSFTAITGATSSSYTTPATTLAQSGTQYICVVTNTVGSTPSNAATLTVTTAPATTNYVTSTSLGGLRNDFSGWVGMSFTVGSSPVTVSGLGRMFAPGDTGSHTVKIVTASSSQDLTGGSVTISMAGGTAGSFVYANLPSTVTLSANTAYYILSQEAAAGDQWYDINTTITTTAVASETSAVWSQNGATYTPIGTAGQAYVPVDFVYTTTTTLSQPAFTKQPQSQTVSAGATATFSVTATGGGLSYQWQSEAPGGSSFTAITGATSSSYTTPATTLAQSGTQYMCVVTNTVGSTPSNAATLTVTSAPASTNYVTSTSPGTLRNNFSGWVGMAFTVGNSPVTVSGLGRMFAPGDAGNHTVEIVTASNSQEVAGGSVVISMAGGTTGSFVYANLPSTVTLNANTTYYILSQETSGGDQWYDINTTVTTSAVASEIGAVWSQNGTTYNPIGSAGQAYVPVDFLYTTSLSQPGITTQPQSQTVGAGATATFSVTATGGGLSYQWQSEAPGGSSFTNITGATSSSYTTPATTLAQSGTQFMCVVTNTVGSTPSNAATLTVTSAPPTTNYVTATTLGTLRNDFSGWVGMAITVGNVPISVGQLGRMVASGNTGTHALKIVNASSGQDLNGSLTSVNTSGVPSGSFLYASLTSPLTLQANTTYYIVSQEAAGGDEWYDVNTTFIQTTSAATQTGGVWSATGTTTYNLFGPAGQSYVPVDFKYNSLEGAAFVTAISSHGQVQNNFTGWVGAAITTGATAVQVTQLGRYFVPGNSGTHTVKVVNASTGVDVSGASVSVTMTNGQANAFVYQTLASPVTLPPNTGYYVVSQETQGGDQWYDYTTAVQTTGVASDTAGVSSPDGITYSLHTGTNQMYVPINFIYSSQ
jgi:YVTN family beta-propeller protein